MLFNLIPSPTPSPQCRIYVSLKRVSIASDKKAMELKTMLYGNYMDRLVWNQNIFTINKAELNGIKLIWSTQQFWPLFLYIETQKSPVGRGDDPVSYCMHCFDQYLDYYILLDPKC